MIKLLGSRIQQQQQQHSLGLALPQLLHHFDGNSSTKRNKRLLHFHHYSKSPTSTSSASPKTALNSCGLPSTFQNSFTLKQTNSSFARSRNFSINLTDIIVRNMSTKHLAKGSTCPPLQDGKVRLYHMKFCPFAQRALLVAEAKGIPHDIVHCDLVDKPEWLLEKNPEGKVPVLETNDGKVLYESLVVADYLDEVFPEQRPLHQADSYKRAIDKIYIQKFDTVISNFYKLFFGIRNSNTEEELKEKISNFVASLKPFEDELARRGTLYFGGGQPGMVDYMIWPWIERIPVIKNKLPDLFDYEAAKKEYPNLENWRQGMKKDPAVAKIILPNDIHQQFIESFLAGTPNYDL